MPIIAKLADNMVDLAETPKEVMILDEEGNPILAGDNESPGKTFLRNIKMSELHHNPDGTIQTIDPMK